MKRGYIIPVMIAALLGNTDPVEIMRRFAAAYGDLACEAFSGNYGGSLDDAEPADVVDWLRSKREIDGAIAARYAALAWRFGAAALILAEKANRLHAYR